MGLLTARSSTRSYFLVSRHRIQAVLNISDFLFFSAYFSLWPPKTCGWITWLSADRRGCPKYSVMGGKDGPPRNNCWSVDLSVLNVGWKPASKGRPVLEQRLLPLTWPWIVWLINLQALQCPAWAWAHAVLREPEMLEICWVLVGAAPWTDTEQILPRVFYNSPPQRVEIESLI